jgi:hypothetical protein
VRVSDESTSPKFFRPIDKFLLTFNFGKTGKKYFVFRLAVFGGVLFLVVFCVLYLRNTILVQDAPNPMAISIETLLTFLVMVVVLFFYSWVLAQWDFTRFLLGLHAWVFLVMALGLLGLFFLVIVL